MRIPRIILPVAAALILSGCGAGAPRSSGAALPGAAAPNTVRANTLDSPPTGYLSTFALNVDTASFGYAQRTLDNGRLPDPATVRPEEFVDHFRQDYPQPAGSGFTLTTDGGRLTATDGGDVRLLRIGLQTQDATQATRRDAHLTFVIDTSGSMANPGRLDLVKDALNHLVDQLRPSDAVSIVTFAGSATLVLPMTAASHGTELHRAIDSLAAADNTNLEAGLVLGYQEAQRGFVDGITNRVILTSDGLANEGDTTAAPILHKVAAQAAKGISLLCVGVGGDYGDKLMENLADHGDGRAVYVSDQAGARELFVHQLPATLEIRARHAKAQVTFDPAQVESYRLIGYDDKGLRAQDFRNDTTDGGAIGPGHAVTALYAVRLAPNAAGHVADVAVRWLDPDSRQPQETGRTITMTDLAPMLWTAGSPRLRVDAVAAYFAEALRNGRPGNAPEGVNISPPPGPFVSHGRVPGEPTLTLPDLATLAAPLATATADPEVTDLTTLIQHAQSLR
ncbi:MAG: von Willebrand factor type domain protein [Actinomycetia bacterium]|nr:von Willebrand factor type domain protein [Actinomycetes bacterium]